MQFYKPYFTMKKLTLLLCFALVAGAVHAQQLGLKAGAAYSTFKGDDAKNLDHRLGYTAGLMYQHHINTLLGVQVETLYTSKGARWEYQASPGGNIIEEKYRLNYIDVPVLLHASAGGLFFDLGPQVSFITKSNRIYEVTSPDGKTTSSTKTNITDQPHEIDFSYVGDIGYRAGNGFGLELRYTGGLKDIGDEAPLDRRRFRNSSFQLMASYLFGGR